MSEGDSFIVSHYGLDGVREHWIPGNRRRGTPAREKVPYATEADARAHLARRHPEGGWTAYECPHCRLWHVASPPRR